MVALKEGCSRRALAANWGDLVAARSSSDRAVLPLVFCEKMHCPYSDLRADTDHNHAGSRGYNVFKPCAGTLAMM